MAYLSLGTDKVYNLDLEMGLQHRAIYQAASAGKTAHWRVEFKPIERYPMDDSVVGNRGLIKDWTTTTRSFGSIDTRDFLWVNMVDLSLGLRGFPRATDLTELQGNAPKFKFFWEKFVSDIVTFSMSEGWVIDFSMHVPNPAQATTNRHRRYGKNNHNIDFFWNKWAATAYKIWVPFIRDTRPTSQSEGQGPSGQTARPDAQTAMDAMAKIAPPSE